MGECLSISCSLQLNLTDITDEASGPVVFPVCYLLELEVFVYAACKNVCGEKKPVCS